MATLGHHVRRIAIGPRHQPLALAQLTERQFFGCMRAVTCLRGPVWQGDPDSDARAEGLAALRGASGTGRLRVMLCVPEADDAEEQPLRAGGYRQVMTGYATARLDLTLDPDTLRAGQHHKWRNRLVFAERQGLEVRRLDKSADRYQWLLEAEAAQQRTKRYQALPPEFVPAWQAAGGHLRILAAYQQDTPIAAMVFLVHGRGATYHLGWTSEEGRKLSAHNLVLWQALGELRRARVHWLDMGGLNTVDTPGIARFKLGTGAQPITLCGTWLGR